LDAAPVTVCFQRTTPFLVFGNICICDFAIAPVFDYSGKGPSLIKAGGNEYQTNR
jgi:hypothetical protein